MEWSRRQVLIILGVTFSIGIVVEIAPSLSQIIIWIRLD